MDEVKIVNLPTYTDDRGCLSVLCQTSDNVMPKIERSYMITNFGKNIVRGYHKHKKNWDCFIVVKGALKIILVDDRSGSDNYKKIKTYVLSDKHPQALIVPPGIWHGLMGLHKGTQFVSICSENLDKSNPDEERISPDSFGNVWEVESR